MDAAESFAELALRGELLQALERLGYEEPTPPMPSFTELPRKDLDAIVGYLAALK